MEDEKEGNGLGITGAVIFLIFLYFVGKWLFSSLGKYEGLSAEEWANDAAYWEDRYYEFRTCVEDYDNMDIAEQIDWGGVFYYCE